MATNSITAADALVKSADRSAENVASSNLDRVLNTTKLPSTPQDLIDTSTKLRQASASDAGVNVARGKLLDVGRKAAQSQDYIADDILAEEKEKARLGRFDEEIDRLTTESFRIFPTFMSRTDILDPAKKRQLAQKAIAINQAEIREIGRKRKEIEDAAERRANSRVGQLQATARILDKELDVAKSDLTASLDQFSQGYGDATDILAAALRMDEAQKKANKSSAGGNGYVGMNSGATFEPDEIALFQYFEEFGNWPVSSSSSRQVEAQLASRYMKWKASGRPGGNNNSPVAQADQPATGSALSGVMASSQLSKDSDSSTQNIDEIDSIIDDIVGG